MHTKGSRAASMLKDWSQHLQCNLYVVTALLHPKSCSQVYFIQLATHFSASTFPSTYRSGTAESVSPRKHVDGTTLCGVDNVDQ
jgi:hypothetical protein